MGTFIICLVGVLVFLGIALSLELSVIDAKKFF